MDALLYVALRLRILKTPNPSLTEDFLNAAAILRWAVSLISFLQKISCRKSLITQKLFYMLPKKTS